LKDDIKREHISTLKAQLAVLNARRATLTSCERALRRGLMGYLSNHERVRKMEVENRRDDRARGYR
jgi:hypothetical protein